MNALGSRSTWHRATGGLVILWLVAAALAVSFHRFLPEQGWLMVHLTLLGAVSNALLIWTQHFTRAITRTAATAGRGGEVARLVVFNAAALTVVAGIVSGSSPVTLIGALAVGTVALWHGVSLARVVRGSLPGRLRAPARYYMAAAALLPPGALLGWWVSTGATGALSAHVAVNVLGWVGLPILGTLVTLWPTVLHVRMDESTESRARTALPVLVGAVLIVALGSLLPVLAGESWATPSRILVSAGLLGFVAGSAWLLTPAAAVTVRDKVGDFPSLSLAAGITWLLGTIAFSGFWVAIEGIPFSVTVSSLVIPLVGGGVVQILLGALGYLLPVMAGGGPSVLRGRIAIVDKGAVWRVVAINSALLFYVMPASSLVLVTTSLAALGVAIISGVRIAMALFRTPEPITYEEAGPDGLNLRSLGHRSGGIVAGLMVALLAVVGGVAGDPAAAGVIGPLGGGTIARGVTASGGEVVAATGEVTRAEIRVEGMRFVPDAVQVPAGNALEITLVNTGDDVHDLVLENGLSTGRLAPGGTAVITTDALATSLDGWCSVAGHRQMGMVFTVEVTGEGGLAADGDGSSSGDEGHGGHGSHDGGANGGSANGADRAVPDLMGTPGDGWEVRDARLTPLGDATEHHVRLEVSEQVVEVAPGVTQSRWMFGDTAPGPVLHGRIGDTFVITLVNDGTIGHSIDFHAGALAPDEPMRTIQPGETLEYRFTATRAGIWMYHCSTMPMSMHIAQGMYGAVVIEPDGLPEVDHEFVLVQGEAYMGPEGGESDAQAIADSDWDLVTFNGYPFQYDHVPLEVGVDERIRIWVLDAGPNAASSFHVVGGQFDTVWMEGDYRQRPGGSDDGVGTGGGAQALGLLPAQGGFVELELPEAGHYPFVSHIMSDAEKGAKGTLRAVER